MTLVLANILTESSQSFQKCDRNSRCRCFCNSLPEILGSLLRAYLHPASGAGEVSG